MPITSPAQWAKNIGGNASDRGSSIANDGNGNVYITGSFRGTADFDTGPGTTNLIGKGWTDIYFAKYDVSGLLLWAKSVGSTNSDGGNSIAVDGSGDVYVTGSFEGMADFDPGVGTTNLPWVGGDDIFFAKYKSSDGSLIWAKSIGAANGASEGGNSIAIDGSGNVYITGIFYGTVDFDPGPGTTNLTSAGYDIFFAKYSGNDGSLIWAKSVGGTTDNDKGNSVAIDGSGNVYITGHFFGTVDFDPGSGTANLTSVGNYDIFFAKYSGNDGSLIWAKSIGGASIDYCSDIVVDGSANVYLTGYFDYTADFDPSAGVANLTSVGYDIFFAKYNSTGSLLWVKGIGGGGTDGSASIDIDGSGNVYVTGSFQGAVDFDPGVGTTSLTSVGGSDIFFAKYNSTGSFVWEKKIGSGGDDFGTSLALDGSGNAYTTGYFNGTADFDPSTNAADTLKLTSSDDDIFFAKYRTIDGLLPVELTSFTATSKNSAVELSWSTVSEINNFGFEIEKAEIHNQSSEKQWKKISFVQGNGTSNIQHHYTFIDKNVTTGKFIYRLKQIDMDGKFTYSEEIEGNAEIPKEITLSQNYPNPFNPVTTINYEIPQTGKVYLKVYNVLGEEVATLVNGMQEAGRYSTQFDASKYSSGIYFYKLTSNNYILVKSMVLVK